MVCNKIYHYSKENEVTGGDQDCCSECFSTSKKACFCANNYDNNLQRLQSILNQVIIMVLQYLELLTKIKSRALELAKKEAIAKGELFSDEVQADSSQK